MAGTTLTQEDGPHPSAAWWLFMLVGLLGVAAGVIVLAKPGDSLAALAVITGIFLLVQGAFEVIASLRRSTANRGVVAVLGVVTLLIGILLVRHPIGGVTAVALLLGLWLIALGVVRLISAFESEERRGWNLAMAAIELIAGIVIVANPHIGYATLALITGISFIFNGIGLFALGWLLHGAMREESPPGRHLGAAA